MNGRPRIARLMAVRLFVIALVLGPPALAGSTQTFAAAARATCNYVELHPGYPGYNGFVTGVDGVGDFACVEDLEDEDPSFSRRAEDRENQQAARSLGISGAADVWTWENWMEIELERGLMPTTCYSCDFQNAAQRTPPTDTDVTWNDPRLACGAFGSTSLMDSFRNRPGYWALGTMDDYQLRAVVTLAYSDSHVNANQLLDGYDQVLDGLVNGKGGAGMIDVSSLWDTMLSQGGYFPVASNANPNDQVFAIEMGLYGFRPFMSEDAYRMLSSNVQYDAAQWGDGVNKGTMTETFSEYLISEGALSWF